MKNLANEIVIWLKDYAVKANRKALIVGVSGGVDSSLVSTLCAMTGLPTWCVILPCQTKPNETTRGWAHIQWLKSKFSNVSQLEINLTNTFETFDKSLPVEFRDSKAQLSFANDKSRLRMIALYHIAGCNSGLVVGTGNKVEDFGVGFFTKYGDGGVDISPIADLMKSEVRQMCRDLGVLPELCEAVPTDGLWADTRTDESQLGATYEELEWAMDWVEKYQTMYYPQFHDGMLTDRQKEVLATYNKWHTAGAHKLAPIPTFKRKILG